jgi:hypothetical protein
MEEQTGAVKRHGMGIASIRVQKQVLRFHGKPGQVAQDDITWGMHQL